MDKVFNISLITVGLIGIFVGLYYEKSTIKSPTPLTPTIEIRIHPDGTQDTTYVYMK